MNLAGSARRPRRAARILTALGVVALDNASAPAVWLGIGDYSVENRPVAGLAMKLRAGHQCQAGSMAKRSASASQAASYSKTALSRAPCWSSAACRPNVPRRQYGCGSSASQHPRQLGRPHPLGHALGV